MKSPQRLVFTGNLRPLWRVVAAVMIPVNVFMGLPIQAMAAATSPLPASIPSVLVQPPPEAFASPPNAPSLTKRPVPVFSSPARTLDFSAAPSDREIIDTRLFEEPLAPVGSVLVPSDNAQLAQALSAFSHATQDLAPLVSYIESHPQSRWKAALLTNLGIIYRNHGYWSKALTSWEASWGLIKNETSPLLKNIGDRTLGELAQLHARLGHYDRLETLFNEADGRDVQGSGTERVAGARAGLWLMKNQPGDAFRCGPLAISKLYQILHPHETVPDIVSETKSTLEGTCLTDLSTLAARIGLDYQIAFRNPGAPILYPSVVHWKVGHFAALTKPMDGGYLTQDLTFGTDTVVSMDALDTEASGYFLVPSGTLPAGWRSVTQAEAKTVFGKGNAGPGGPPPPPCDSPVTNSCQSCSSPHMAAYNMEMESISLMLMDTPVGYSPPIGPSIQFTVNYNHRESAAMTTISNLGSKWSFDWLSYIMAPTDANTRSFGPGGGQLSYTGFNATAGTFDPQLLNQDRLVKVSQGSYIKYHRDGSKEVFDLAETGANPRIFRTQLVDSMGNTMSYGYDANYRIRTVTDAIGQVTVIDYDLATDSANPDYYKITKVTDPFGRYGTFQYNAAGQLWKITDTLGLVSEFTYGSGDFISALTTPYGTTSFVSTDTNYDRGLMVTDPLGGRERVEWVRDSSYVPSSDPATTVPSGFINAYLNYRNTFYWDKKAMDEAPGDYTQARITHWEHTAGSGFADISPVIESTKAPLENRIWRTYAGQDNTIDTGPSNQPSKVARILDDGTEQDFRYEYNAQGNLTKSIDPLGRETDYEYDTNGIDLLRTKQKNGATYDLLSSMTYNSLHLPLTATDASGQTTTYTYNSVGQPLTVTNAKNETTTFVYGTTLGQPDYARLKTVTGALPGSTTTFTYDVIGRQHTTTDSEDYQVVTDYDVFDRPTKVTYPDTTYEQTLYNRLDAEWTQDRLGRWSQQVHDALRHLSQQVDPLNRKTKYEWCTCGSLTGQVDPAGNRTTWTRDIQSRVTAKIYPDQTRTSYTYENTTSRLKKITDAKGQVTNHTYYLDGTLAALVYTDVAGNPLVPATPSVGYTYDPIYTRVATMTDGVGTTVYTYNPIPVVLSPAVTGANRLANSDGPLANESIAYTYDEVGRTVTRSINGSANPSSVHFDALGRVDQTINLLGTFVYAYVGVTGRVDHVDYPNGQKIAYDYFDNVGDQRLKQIKNLGVGTTPPILSEFDYTYDATGAITTWTKNYQGAPNAQRYEPRYDAANQLVGAALKNPATNDVLKEYGYGYDASGNRTQEQIDSNLTTSGFNNLNQLTSQSAAGIMEFSGTLNEPGTITLAGQEASVDATNNWRGKAVVTIGANSIPVVATDVNGNVANKTINVAVTGGTDRAVTYDLNGALIDDGAGKTYAYDAANRLVKITQGTNLTEFVYNGSGQRVQEKLNGLETKQWIWGSDAQPCEERDASNNVTKNFFGVVGERIEGVNCFYTTDHLGSVKEMTDSTGAVRARYDYDPYGRITKVSGDLEADFGFTGFYRHQASGLNLTMYRAYDADLGRWLSRDPIEEEGGLNLYAYVNSSPFIQIDPAGLSAVGTIAGAAFGAYIGASVGAAVGGLLGASSGAAIGTFALPGGGTLAGGLVGGGAGATGGATIGGVIGGIIGGWIGGAISGPGASAMGKSRERGENWASREAKVRAGRCGDPCQVLGQMLNDETDTQKKLDIVQAQKFLGCRNIRKRGSN